MKIVVVASLFALTVFAQCNTRDSAQVAHSYPVNNDGEPVGSEHAIYRASPKAPLNVDVDSLKVALSEPFNAGEIIADSAVSVNAIDSLHAELDRLTYKTNELYVERLAWYKAARERFDQEKRAYEKAMAKPQAYRADSGGDSSAGRGAGHHRTPVAGESEGIAVRRGRNR